MASYYYLISSLPMLRADGALPFSYQEFLDLCSSSLRPEVFSKLENLDMCGSKGPLLSEWSEYYGSLMEELNYRRNLKLGKPAKAPGFSGSEASSAVRLAMSAQNPLEGERILLRQEFEKLDSLVSMHFFDESVLFGYAIKLKLLERLYSFSFEEGKEEFSALLGEVQQKILSL